MKTVAVILARTSSRRLERKALVELGGEPIIKLILERLNRVELIDDVVVATNPSSQDLINYCEKASIKYFVGSENDVLSRLTCVASRYKADIVVRVWHDTPLIEPRIVNHLISSIYNGYEYAFPIGFPKGIGCTAMRFSSLESILLRMDTIDRAIWNKKTENLIWELLGKSIFVLKNVEDLSGIDLSIDTEEELGDIRGIFDGEGDI